MLPQAGEDGGARTRSLPSGAGEAVPCQPEKTTHAERMAKSLGCPIEDFLLVPMVRVESGRRR